MNILSLEKLNTLLTILPTSFWSLGAGFTRYSSARVDCPIITIESMDEDDSEILTVYSSGSSTVHMVADIPI